MRRYNIAATPGTLHAFKSKRVVVDLNKADLTSVSAVVMTADEALWAATAGGARALQRDDVGVLAPGKRADLVLLDAPSHLHLAYRPGVPLIRSVMKEGRFHGRR